MRDWLMNVADLGRIKGLEWLDARKTLLKVPWKHASRRGWHVDHDACIFHAWALYTGKVNEEGSNPKKWKANFRCAMNSLPDVLEERDRSHKNGDNAFRVYRFYSPGDKPIKVRQPRPPANVDVWSSRSTRGSSVDSDKERDEVARAVLGLQRNQSFASAPSSGSDRDSPPQPHGRRSSDSSYGDDQSIFKAAKVSSHLPISDYKDVPACVEEVTVVSSGGGNSSHHHDDFTEVPADMDTSFDERNFDDSFESNRAMLPLMVEDFTEEPVNLPSPAPVPVMMSLPSVIPPIGTFVAGYKGTKMAAAFPSVPFIPAMPMAFTLLSLPQMHQQQHVMHAYMNQMPASVAAEFGMASDGKVTFQGLGFEYPPTDDESSAITRQDVNLAMVN